MTTPLLERLLNCKESTKFIIIEDTISQSGYILLKEFIKKVAINQNHRVVLLCFEISPKWLLENINPQQNIEIFDAYSKSEAYDLEDDITLTDLCDNYNFIKNFNDLSEITNIIKDTIHKLSSSNYTIIIDSISPLLLISTSLTFNFLQSISSMSDTNINRVITVYHSDIPNYPTSGISGYLNVRNTLLYHIASTTIIIKNIEQFRTSRGYITTENHAMINAFMNSPEGSICTIEHRKKSGRVLYEINSYNITESSGNIVIQLVKDIKDDAEPEDNTPDPTTANLLFNLSLTESQKKAKNELVLPYVKIQVILVYL
ncbi:13590_t:CDS:2 [Funneliformis geosporum]|uniref:Elongator complex protein 5 n=1 Tax=Funneliformis geosporum TaxID=1117311 RepID=A0A9W4WVJ8_9GLOM|nr:13590_t:CDS:2 [Funneliformis geosporum]